MNNCTLISTSSFITRELETKAKENVLRAGFSTITSNRITKRFLNKWAGTPSERLEQIQDAFSKEKDCVWNCFGESGIIQFIDAIKYNQTKNITLIGSSDCSILINKFYEETGNISIYGPNASTHIDQDSMSLLKKNINKKSLQGKFNIIQRGMKKRITGTIKGGNLISLTWGIGLKHEINLRDKIVFFDKLGKDNYSTYNNFIQLLNTKLFKPKMIILAKLPKKDPLQLKQMFKELFPEIPIIYKLQFGKKAKKISIPIGGRCTIDMNTKIIKIKQVPKKRR